RRDLGRFLRGERETCPPLPRGYFDDAAAARLADFAAQARADRREDVLADFPLAIAEAGIRHGWHEGAVRIYANWLSFLRAQKALHADTRAVPPPRDCDLRRPDDRLRGSFIDRRGGNDPAGPFNGPRDRRRTVFPRVS